MSEAHIIHKIKAEWTKASKNEVFDNSSSESDRLEIVEEAINDESETTIRKSKKIEIIEQIVIYPSQKSVKCHFCDKNFEKSALEEHLRTHDETFFECPECDKKFKRKSSLRKHLNYLHKKKFKYECNECNVNFIDLTKFELHQNTKHKTKESQRRYQCHEADCSKTFASPEYLKRHQVTHNDEYKYKCSSCDQKFKWMTSLQVHQSIHTQNKTLIQCDVCFKRFFNHRTLERHQKLHKNVKFKCTLCDKVISARKDNIRRHIRHLHGEVDKTEISSKIETVESRGNIDFDNEEDSNEQDDVNEPVKSQDFIEEQTYYETSIPQFAPVEPPVINNRVNVIQSIGNPNKHQSLASQKVNLPQVIDAAVAIEESNTTEHNKPLIEVKTLEPTIKESTSTSDSPLELTKAEIPPESPPRSISSLPQETEKQIKLPPKKKAIAFNQPNSGSTATSKPRYDPIEHYRKILLGLSRDDDHDHTTSIEDNAEEEDHDQETQVFPVHWRKRTSQNFLFRR